MKRIFFLSVLIMLCFCSKPEKQTMKIEAPTSTLPILGEWYFRPHQPPFGKPVTYGAAVGAQINIYSKETAYEIFCRYVTEYTYWKLNIRCAREQVQTCSVLKEDGKRIFLFEIVSPEEIILREGPLVLFGGKPSPLFPVDSHFVKGRVVDMKVVPE